MANYRRGRVNEAVTNEVSQIMGDVKDPRLAGLFITVTGADVTPDLKYAKIFYSVIGEYDKKELNKALKSVAPFVRSQLAKRLNMRNTPEIQFVFDESVERGAHLNELFRKIEQSAPATESDESDEDEETESVESFEDFDDDEDDDAPNGFDSED